MAWIYYPKVTIALFPASFRCHLSLKILLCYALDLRKWNFLPHKEAWVLCPNTPGVLRIFKTEGGRGRWSSVPNVQVRNKAPTKGWKLILLLTSSTPCLPFILSQTFLSFCFLSLLLLPSSSFPIPSLFLFSVKHVLRSVSFSLS